MKGTWLLPTLNRPSELVEFFKTYQETESSTPVWVLVDNTDPSIEAYRTMKLPDLCEFIWTDAITMGDKVREVWGRFKDLDYVGILNDDHRLKTKGWDQKILSQINGTNIISTNDGWVAPNRICGAICFSGKILRTLNYMFLPGMHHLFSDDLWAYLFGKSNSCKILMDVLVEHDHAYKNAAKKDSTFEKINGPLGLVQTPEGNVGQGGFWPNDKKVFEEWLSSGQAEKDLQKIVDLQPRQGVMIATPSHDGNVAMAYALGLADATLGLAQNGVYFEMARVVGSSLIPHARNSLVDMFLKSKCQRLLMIDSDQGFDKNTVFALLQSPRLIIAGITPHKRFPINLNFEPLEADKHFFKSLVNKSVEEFKEFAKAKADPLGNIEVNRAGTGVMMIDRKVFEIMKDHIDYYEPFDDKSDIKHGEFFKMGGAGEKGTARRYYGEDWFFTELAKKLKIPIYINANVIVSHQGSYTFTA